MSRDGPERTGGTRGVSHPAKQFGRSTVRFLLIRGGVRFESLAGTSSFWFIVGKGGSVCMSEGMMREDDHHNNVHVLSGFPPCEIEGVDEED